MGWNTPSDSEQPTSGFTATDSPCRLANNAKLALRTLTNCISVPATDRTTGLQRDANRRGGPHRIQIEWRMPPWTGQLPGYQPARQRQIVQADMRRRLIVWSRYAIPNSCFGVPGGRGLNGPLVSGAFSHLRHRPEIPTTAPSACGRTPPRTHRATYEEKGAPFCRAAAQRR